MRTFIVLGLIGAAGAAACGSSNSTADADITTYDCADDTRAETYTVGDEHMGAAGMIDVKLMSADPAPPARGNNTWVMLLSSMSDGVVGAPMDGMESDIEVTPYMPDHMHGTPLVPQITPVDGQTGQYTLTPVNLWMPGLWATTIAVDLGSASDKVVYNFCLPE
ncbi:MAG TPA: FixH family protein [Kofleriaceae bacterium]|jgi:hypothetical protein